MSDHNIPGTLTFNFEQTGLRDRILGGLIEKLSAPVIQEYDVESILKMVRALLKVSSDPQLAQPLALTVDTLAARLKPLSAFKVGCLVLRAAAGGDVAVAHAVGARVAALADNLSPQDLADKDLRWAAVPALPFLPDAHAVKDAILSFKIDDIKKNFHQYNNILYIDRMRELLSSVQLEGSMGQRITEEIAAMERELDESDGEAAVTHLRNNLAPFAESGDTKAAIMATAHDYCLSRPDRPLAIEAMAQFKVLAGDMLRNQPLQDALDSIGEATRVNSGSRAKGNHEPLRQAFAALLEPVAQDSLDKGDFEAVLQIAHTAETVFSISCVLEALGMKAFKAAMGDTEQKDGLKAAVMKAKKYATNRSPFGYPADRAVLSCHVFNWLADQAETLLYDKDGGVDFVVEAYLRRRLPGFVPASVLGNDGGELSSFQKRALDIVLKTAEIAAIDQGREKAAGILLRVLQEYRPSQAENGAWHRIAQHQINYIDMPRSHAGLDQVVDHLLDDGGRVSKDAGHLSLMLPCNIAGRHATSTYWVNNSGLTPVEGVSPDSFVTRLKNPAP